MPDQALVQQGVPEQGLGDGAQGDLQRAAGQEEGLGRQEGEDGGWGDAAEKDIQEGVVAPC